MKIVAPLVLTLGLSFVLYRETGKWNPIEVWPKADYDSFIAHGKSVGQRPFRGGYTARDISKHSRMSQPDWVNEGKYAGDKADSSVIQSRPFQYGWDQAGKSAQNPIDTSNE